MAVVLGYSHDENGPRRGILRGPSTGLRAWANWIIEVRARWPKTSGPDGAYRLAREDGCWRSLQSSRGWSAADAAPSVPDTLPGMREMRLEKPARNEIVEAIKASPFDLSEFRSDGDTPGLVMVSHKPSGSTFYVEQSGPQYQAMWRLDGKDSDRCVGGKLAGMVALWLIKLKEDVDTPDLWAELGKEPPVSVLMEEQDNADFSALERQEIDAWVAEVKQTAQHTYELSVEQMKVLEAKLDYVGAAAHRTGRLDWLNLTVGALLGTIANDVLTPTVTRGILQTLVASVGHLFGHPLPQLPA